MISKIIKFSIFAPRLKIIIFSRFGLGLGKRERGMGWIGDLGRKRGWFWEIRGMIGVSTETETEDETGCQRNGKKAEKCREALNKNKICAAD